MDGNFSGRIQGKVVVFKSREFTVGLEITVVEFEEV